MEGTFKGSFATEILRSRSDIRRMIRVLFIILAVVSMALAFVLSISWLWLVAAVMLVVAAVILTVDTKKRLRRTAIAGSKAADTMRPLEDLGSFGLSEVRAVERSLEGGNEAIPDPGSEKKGAMADHGENEDATMVATPERSSPPPAIEQPPTSAMETPAGTLVSEPVSTSRRGGVVRKRARRENIMVEGVVDSLRGEVILSTLRGLRAAVDAVTVAVLRQERAPLGYTVEAMVSRNSFARSGGRFAASEPLVASGKPLSPVVERCNSRGGFDSKRLGYYHEPIAIHEVAFVPMACGGDTYLLIADTMSDGVLAQPESGRMLREFARLIQALVAEPAKAQEDPAGQQLRPRREIIAEEMKAARESSLPLALALVHLNQAESLSDLERPETETSLADKLEATADGGRVERFGELTYGILRKQDVDDMARWASALHAGFLSEAGTLRGGVSVGVAMLGDRHDGPDELRADATAALRESYETGECIILD